MVAEDSGMLRESVPMFDLKAFEVLGCTPGAEDADAILFDVVSKRVFTLNEDAHSSAGVDPQAGKLITNTLLGGKPKYGVPAGNGKVYATSPISAKRWISTPRLS